MIHPRASVIIPSYNGKDKLIHLLQSLENQTIQDIEIIVIIDGSTDGTLQHIKSVGWMLPGLKLIEQQNRGRAGARNRGAQEATSDLLIFFDDDMILDAHCIEKHIEANASVFNTIFMGQVIEPCTPSDPEIRQYKNYLNISWAKVLAPYKNAVIPRQHTILSAQNMSVSTSVFAALHGFDEWLKDIEDYDLALRAKQKAISIFYLDSALAVHADFFNFQKYAERSKNYLTNRRLAATLKPELYANDPVLMHKDSIIQKAVYSFFKFKCWIYLLDNFNILRFILPEKMRYALYGIILTAHVKNSNSLK